MGTEGGGEVRGLAHHQVNSSDCPQGCYGAAAGREAVRLKDPNGVKMPNGSVVEMIITTK
jgi:hypothetical protein